MSDDFTRLGRELQEMERRDPALAAARQRIDEVMSPHERWRRQMVRDLWVSEKAER